MTAIV